jgi:hypothetical protein
VQRRQSPRDAADKNDPSDQVDKQGHRFSPSVVGSWRRLPAVKNLPCAPMVAYDAANARAIGRLIPKHIARLAS